MANPTVRSDGTTIYTVRITLRPGIDDELIKILGVAHSERRLAPTLVQLCKTGMVETVARDDVEIDLSDLGMEV